MTLNELLKSREGKLWGPIHTAEVMAHLKKIDVLVQAIFDQDQSQKAVRAR